MPEGVSVWLEEILKGFRKHKFMLPKTSVIENAKLLITGTVYEDLYALQRPPHSRQMSGLRLRATFSPMGLRPSRSTWRLRRTLGWSTTTTRRTRQALLVQRYDGREPLGEAGSGTAGSAGGGSSSRVGTAGRSNTSHHKREWGG